MIIKRQTFNKLSKRFFIFIFLTTSLLPQNNLKSSTQTIPENIWGKWRIHRELPTTTHSCWGEKEAKQIIGTEIEYRSNLFRWKNMATKNPKIEIKTINAEQYHDEHSGQGTNSSQVTFQQLGIKSETTTQVAILHPNAHISGDITMEIPGDVVLIKDKDTIVFSMCNGYFEAK